MVKAEDLRDDIRSVPDFPKKGIVFLDITTLIKQKEQFAAVIDRFHERYKSERIEKVVGIESRGFIFGGALAHRLGAGFVPVRKPGKLPSKTLREEYQLEYGTDSLEIHMDAISAGERILLIDDLLATGGTASAAGRLIRQLNGTIVSIAFLIELTFLKGREKLPGYDVFSLVTYDAE